MSNNTITTDRVNIESLVNNFDNDTTYLIQNIGSISLIFETEMAGETKTTNILQNKECYYKHDSTKTVYVKVLNGKGYLSIQPTNIE